MLESLFTVPTKKKVDEFNNSANFETYSWFDSIYKCVIIQSDFAFR